MTYPPEFTPFAWEDLPSEGTPVDKAELNTVEQRLAKFAEEYQGVNWRPPVKKESELNTLYKPKGTNVRIGDVAFVFETNEIFVYGASEEWKSITVEALHWKAPVVKESNLPTTFNVVGDIRFVEEAAEFYHCIATVGTVAEQWQSGHWRPPVKKVSELPAEALNKNSDVIYVEDTERHYVWSSSKKEWLGRTRTVNASKKSTLPTEVHNVQGDIGWAEEEKRIYIWNAGAKEWQLQELEGTAALNTTSNLTLETPKKAAKENQDSMGVRVNANEKQFLVFVGADVSKGKVEFKILKNGTAVKFEGAVETLKISEGETKVFFKPESSTEVKDKDELTVEVTNEETAPKNLNVSLNIEHQVKLKVT